ncbi:MAG: hypothetical protein ACRD0J_05575 [Acidimicrobiales bacterium]
MPTLTFEGETQDEIVRQVRRWLAGIDGGVRSTPVSDAVERASGMTRDALAVIAQSAPGPLSRNEVFKALTRMGYEVTESTRRAVLAGLDGFSEAPGQDGTPLVKRVERARNSVLYEMNSAVARQVLRSLTGRS